MTATASSAIHVDCYAGYKAEQEPRRFTLKTQTYEVQAVLDRWYGEDSDYFKVRADDGNLYTLRHHRAPDYWRLEAYRKSQ